MRIIYSIVLSMLVLFSSAQTNPPAQALPYSENFTTTAHTSTVYPAGCIGWVTAAPSAAFTTAAPTGDRVLIASSTATTNSGNVHNYNGKIGFLNNSSLDLSLAVAVNTTGQTNVAVAYDVMTIRNPHDGTTNTRVNEITLQYRVGITGTFTTLTGIEYQNNTTTSIGAVTTPQNVVNKTIVLPAACNNQAVVQLRWTSREISGGGARPSFAIDNIVVGTGAPDTTPPTVTTLSPVDNATLVPITSPLVITFNEAVQIGTGNILVKQSSDNTTVQTIDVTTSAVTIAGSTATITLIPLAITTGYYIEMAAGVFKDLSNNNFVGITGATTWNFTTNAPTGGVTTLDANFNTCTTALTDGFTQFSLTGPQVWACTTFGRDPLAPAGTTAFPNAVQINGFASGSNVINEDWLISPALNLTGTTFPLLSFWSRTAFNGAPLKLRVSTNYAGSGNPSAATWTDLVGQFPAQTSNIWKLSQNINLSAFKTATTYFAFVYNSTDDDGARWTVDDVKIDNSPIAPPASVTPNTGEVNFGFVASGSTLVKTMAFTANDISGGVTLTATGNFLISKTNGSFTPSITYTQVEANNIGKTVYVQFAPTTASLNYVGNLTLSTPTVTDTIVILKGNSIDAATTLEVVNWNIEWFGSTTLGPTNKNLQEQNVKTILQNIGADIYALEEVVSETRLANIVSQMPGYSYVLSNYGSYTNPNQAGAGTLADAQKLGMIYKTALFPAGVTSQALLSAGVNTAADVTNPAYNWYASGRFPFMVTGTTTLGGITKQLRFIITHAKANTSPTLTSYNRRKAGNDSLRTHLNTFYPNDNIIFLGDLNDDLDSTITAGITPKFSSYKQFMDDATNFSSPTLALSLAGKKSTVSYNDVIDHVIISNEMKCSYMAGSAAILTDVAALIPNYGNTTTDHYPVFTRYQFVASNAATISYAGSPYCNSTVTVLPTIVGTTGGTFTSTTGLTLNATTGEINLATSTLGNYTVTYTIASGGACASSVTATANIDIRNSSVAPTSITASNPVVCNVAGGTTNLTATGGTLATGASYKWYTASCGGTLIGTGNTITNVPVAPGANTFYVRAEGVCNNTTCASIIINTGVQPSVTIAANSSNGITPSTTPITLTATATPAGTYTYQWFKDNVLVTGENTATINVNAFRAGSYKARVIATSGCDATSISSFVSSASSPTLYITANPNNGIFNVSFFNGDVNTNGRTLSIFDSKGAKVLTQTYGNITPAYGFMKVNISNLAKGIYFLVLRDANGKELATGSVSTN